MDFKTRFQGKTSMITKDGGIETAISTTKMPINKVDMAGMSSNSNFNSKPFSDTQNQLITYGNNSSSSGFNNGMNSQSSNFGIGGNLQQQQRQQMQQSQFNQNPLLMNNTATSNHSYFNKFNNNNPYDYTPSAYQDNQNLKQNNMGGFGQALSPNRQADLDDLHADNIYLKGGQNMAEALQKKRETQNQGQQESFNTGATQTQNQISIGGVNTGGPGMSIAMRMKRNRDAQLGLKNQVENSNDQSNNNNNQSFGLNNELVNPFGNGTNQNNNQNSDQYWGQATTYSNNSHFSQNQTPIASQQSQRPHNIQTIQQNAQTPTTNQQLLTNLSSQQQTIINSSNSKPPSQNQNLRGSVEKHRHSNFANVSKHIIQTQQSLSNARGSYTSQNASGYSDLSLGQQKYSPSQFRRMNSNMRNQDNIKTLNEGEGQSKHILLKQRAASVSNPLHSESNGLNTPMGFNNISNFGQKLNEDSEKKNDDDNNQATSKTNQINNGQAKNISKINGKVNLNGNLVGIRSAGLRSQQAKGSTKDLNQKNQEQSSANQISNNPYQQIQPPQPLFPLITPGMPNMMPALQQFQQPGQYLTPEQLQQQILMMQHQMLMLQQQQQFIYGGNISNVPPQSSPALLQMTNQGGILGNPSNRQDIYKQFELADQKYMEKNSQQNQNPQGKPLTTGGVGSSYQSSQTGQNKINMGSGDSQSTTTTGSLYKPYTVKDYKNFVQTQQQLKLGGLGANIGGDEWEKAKKKQEQIQEYAKQLRMQNQNKPPQIKKLRDEKPKEKTSREKALEFSRQIPKPKIRNGQLIGNGDNESDIYNGNNAYTQQSQTSSQYLNGDLNGIEEDDEGGYDEYGNTVKGADLASLQQLDLKNQEYASELEKIKQMIM